MSNESQRNPGGIIPTVLVTGGSGFVGSHTVEHLLSRGFHVRCVLRPRRRGLGWLEGSAAEIVRADLTDAAQLIRHLDGVEYVFHVAGVTKARQAQEFYVGNVLTTQALLSAVRKVGTVRKFAYVSSLSAAGPSLTGEPLTEEAACHPVSLYGQTKLEGESVVRRAGDRVPWVILRPPAVFGPRDTDILEMFNWIRRGIRPIIGSREKTVSLVYVPDLARGIVEATLSARTAGETYHVCDPVVFRFPEVLEYVASLVGGRTFAVPFPPALAYAVATVSEGASLILRTAPLFSYDKVRELLHHHWVCSPEKLSNHTGFRTQVSAYDGIRMTYEWYKSMQWL
jgi:nucleoside-diphosphate-sugar epimerase